MRQAFHLSKLGFKYGTIAFALLVMISSPSYAKKAQPKTPDTSSSLHVPLVMCPSDGQLGFIKAEENDGEGMDIDVPAPKGLSYYKGHDLGVLAPDGWFCLETYGSNGSTLYVAPRPITKDVFSPKWKGFSGDAIQLSMSYGETSGRFFVARLIARVFPSEKAFAESVMRESADATKDFTFGPFPKDVLTYKNDQTVEYQTAANTEGLGTMGRLQKNRNPIEGSAMLISETHDSMLLNVRLPARMRRLVSSIIQQSEEDAIDLQ